MFIVVGLPPQDSYDPDEPDDPDSDVCFYGSRPSMEEAEILRDSIARRLQSADAEYERLCDELGNDKSDQVYEDVCRRFEVEYWFRRLAILKISI